MPLQKQPLPLQFQGGVDTKTDGKQVPAAKLLVLENATFVKQTTLVKRNGYAALSQALDDGSGNYASPVGMVTRGDEMLLLDGSKSYAYRDSTSTWHAGDEVASVIATDTPIARTGTAQTMVDHATNGGVTVVAWEDSRGGVRCSVLEEASGRVLLADTSLDTSGRIPRCVAVGTVLHVYWWTSGTTYLNVAIVNPAQPSAVPSQSILTTDFDSSNPYFDASDAGPLYSTVQPAVIAWKIAGSLMRVAYVHPSGVFGSAITGLPPAATWGDPISDAVTGPIAIAPDRIGSANVAVVYCNNAPNIRWLAYNDLTSSSGTVALTATTGTWNRCAVEVLTGTVAWWAAELDGATDDVNRVECGSASQTPAVVTSARSLRGHGLLSRAFVDNGQVYAVVGHGVKYFPYAAVVRISASSFGGSGYTQCYARLVPSELIGLPARNHVTSVQPVSPSSAGLSRQHRVTLGYRIQLAVDTTQNAVSANFAEDGARLVTIDFANAAAYQSAPLGAGAYLGGACLSHYDGKRWAEADFHCAPDTAAGGFTASQIATDAASLAQATYNYVACYEEVDAQGEVHQGAVSAPVSLVINAANKRAQLVIPTYRLTTKRHVRIGVYRSPGNQTGEPSAIPYYRVTDTDPTNAVGNNCYIENDPTVDSVTFTDALSDAQLIAREPLYTNGGILSNDPAPINGKVLAGSKSRLFAVDQTNPNVVRFSQEIDSENDRAIEWPIGNTVLVDPYGGDIVGIGILDDAVIVFKETAVYAFGGPGPLADPTADPAGHSWSTPQLVTSDVGCKSPASICQTPAGIVFQSSKGIMLIDRSRQVQDIGRDVYAYNANTIRRATLLPDRHQVIFLSDAADATLLWDYERQQWSVFTNHAGLDATVRNGVYHYLRTDGRVFKETPGTYRDDNLHIRRRIRTAWIKLSGYLQGWQRILWLYFLGNYQSSHQMAVRYALDYNEGFSDPILLDVDNNQNPQNYGAGNYGDGYYGGAGGDSTRYQRRIFLNKRCQAICIEVYDVEPTGTYGAAFDLSELLIIGGILGPAFKPGPARTN